MPKRIQLKRTSGWKMPIEAVRVTRPSEFGNPFKIHHAKPIPPFDGSKDWWVECGTSIWMFITKSEAQSFAVDAFGKWLAMPQQERLRARARLHLKGKDLACWCPLDQPCHADVLLELANKPPEEVA